MCHFARVGRAQFIYAGEANVRGAASKEGCSMCGGIFAVFAIVRAMRVGGGAACGGAVARWNNMLNRLFQIL